VLYRRQVKVKFTMQNWMRLTKLNSTKKWSIKRGRWEAQLIYEGENICFFPGDLFLIEVQFERYLKQIAYTCERDIDFTITQVAERVGQRIFRGIIFRVEDWLFKRLTIQTTSI
jgi:hypothetical protein